MNPQIHTPELHAISALLSREICAPLDELQAGLERLLNDPLQPPSTSERTHAMTMLTLCDDLRRLTTDCLNGTTVAPPDQAMQQEVGVGAGRKTG